MKMFNYSLCMFGNLTYKKFSLGFENITVIYEVQSCCSLGYIKLKLVESEKSGHAVT